jgi:hypothetical protein
MLSIYSDNLKTMSPEELAAIQATAMTPQGGSLLSGTSDIGTPPPPVTISPSASTPVGGQEGDPNAMNLDMGSHLNIPNTDQLANDLVAPIPVPANPANSGGFLTRLLSTPEAKAMNMSAATPAQINAMKPTGVDAAAGVMSVLGPILMAVPGLQPIGLALLAAGGVAGVPRYHARKQIAADVQAQAMRGPQTTQEFSRNQAQTAQNAAERLALLKGSGKSDYTTQSRADYENAMAGLIPGIKAGDRVAATDYAQKRLIELTGAKSTATNEARMNVMADKFKLDPATLKMAITMAEAGDDWTKILPPRGMNAPIMVKQVGDAIAQDLESRGLTGKALVARKIVLKATDKLVSNLEQRQGMTKAYNTAMDAAISATESLYAQLQKSNPGLTTGSNWANAVQQWVSKGTTDNAVLNALFNSLNDATLENAKLVSGGVGSSAPTSDSMRALTAEMLKTSFAPKSIKKVLKVMKISGNARVNSYQSALRDAMKGQFPDETNPAFNKPPLTNDLIQAFSEVAGHDPQAAQQMAYDFGYDVEAP